MRTFAREEFLLKTRILIALLAAFFLAGCAQGGATTEGDFDMNICLENPDDPGCKATTSVDCEKYFWLAECAGQVTDTEDGDTDDGSDSGDDDYVFDEGEGEKVIPAFQVKQSMTVYGKKSQILYIPLEIKAGTGEGPFFWTFDGQGAGATLGAGGTNFRNATIAWYPPSVSKTVFTVMVSDKARPDLAPKVIKVTVVINEKIAINARFVGGKTSGAALGTTYTSLNNYTVDEIDLRLYKGEMVQLQLFVANLSLAGYEFRSLSSRFTVHTHGCDEAECYATAMPNHYASDATGVGFSVRSRATGETSTLVIKKVLLSASGEDTSALCSDGKDNDNDGFTDLADDSCAAFRKAETTDSLCSDGKDNDGDEKVDCKDTECASTTPCKDPGTTPKTISSVTVNIQTSDIYYNGPVYLPVGAKAIVHFCKDRDCVDKLGPFEINSMSANLTRSFTGMVGKDPAYLNYFTVKLDSSSSSSSMTDWFLRSVKVTYYLKDNFTLQTAYWNPCADRFLGNGGQAKFGKNDTAVCAVTYIPVEDNAGTDSDIQLVIDGANFSKIEDALGTPYGYAPQFTAKSETVDYLALMLDWDKNGWLKNAYGDYISDDLEQGAVASYGQTVFDCNPFNSLSCEAQRKNFDDKKTRPEFQYMGSKRIYMNVFKHDDDMTFGWYQMFIFQPGYVKNSSDQFVSNSIHFVMDDKDDELSGTGDESRKCSPKNSSTIWNDQRFGNMGDCFYGTPSESDDERCRLTLPNPDTTNYCL